MIAEWKNPFCEVITWKIYSTQVCGKLPDLTTWEQEIGNNNSKRSSVVDVINN